MNLLDELRANLRLRVGLAFILGVFCLYGLLEWRDYLAERRVQYRQLAGQVARIGLQQSQAEWIDRSIQANEALRAAETRLWRQASFGLAQAEMQDWLYTQLRHADAKRANVNLSDPTAQLGLTPNAAEQDSIGLTKLHAKVDFFGDAPVLLALLSAIVDADRQVVVNALSIKSQRVEIDIGAWYMAPAASAPAAAPVSPLQR